MDDRDAEIRARLLADVLANPDDDGPRLVFADWLVQHGDKRGELITTQCALERATGAARAKLVNRASDLLYRHGTWLREALDIVRGVETRRGFIYAINAKAPVFAKHAAPLFDREPIEELRVIDPSARDLATLALAPHLAKLRSLVLLEPVRLDTIAHATQLRALLASPHLARIRALDLRLTVGADAEASVHAGIGSLALHALASLKLRVRAVVGGALVPAAIVAALGTAELPALTQVGVKQDAVAALRAKLPGRIAITALAD
jgi:uncharacterized protein (TIGR02996 family)